LEKINKSSKKTINQKRRLNKRARIIARRKAFRARFIARRNARREKLKKRRAARIARFLKSKAKIAKLTKRQRLILLRRKSACLTELFAIFRRRGEKKIIKI